MVTNRDKFVVERGQAVLQLMDVVSLLCQCSVEGTVKYTVFYNHSCTLTAAETAIVKGILQSVRSSQY